jgi:hypothetical protein
MTPSTILIVLDRPTRDAVSAGFHVLGAAPS